MRDAETNSEVHRSSKNVGHICPVLSCIVHICPYYSNLFHIILLFSFFLDLFGILWKKNGLCLEKIFGVWQLQIEVLLSLLHHRDPLHAMAVIKLEAAQSHVIKQWSVLECGHVQIKHSAHCLSDQSTARIVFSEVLGEELNFGTLPFGIRRILPLFFFLLLALLLVFFTFVIFLGLLFCF